jgi:iron complex outermembrane receptor protein
VLADDPIPTVLDFSTSTKQLAAFVDDVLELSPQWSVVGGLRFDRIRYSRDNQALALSGREASSFDSNYSEWSGRAGVVYQPFKGMSVYAQYSRATDPVTSPATMSSSQKAFDPTRGRQYEVGLKQQLMAGRAEYTLAWFDISKTNLVTNIPGTPFSEQVGEQSSHGIEATLRLNPTRALSIDLNATWVDAQFDEYYSSGVSLAGNKPSDVPSTTANAWINWAATRQFSVGAGARYVGSRFADSENIDKMPAYTVVDARAGWHFTSQLQMDLRVRNLTNERNQVISEYAPGQWIFGDPRTYAVSFTYSH